MGAEVEDHAWLSQVSANGNVPTGSMSLLQRPRPEQLHDPHRSPRGRPLGAYSTEAERPVIVIGSPLENIDAEQRIILVHVIEHGTRRLELGLSDPIPAERPANVRAANTPAHLASFQADSILVFE